MTSEIKNKIKQTLSLIDESFQLELSKNYQLTLLISVDGITASIQDVNKKKYIAIEQFVFTSVYNFDIIPALLDEVIKESKIINGKYAKVNFIISNNLSTLIPSPLYDEERKKLYLKLNTELQGDEFILENDIQSIQSKSIFAVPIRIKTIIDSNYQDVNYLHASTILIESIILFNKNQNNKKAFVNVSQTHFEVLIIEGNNLLYYNSFNYHSAEDFIYYILFVTEQLQLNPEKIEINLMGEIDKNSPQYTILSKYIRNIKFVSYSNSNYDYSYQLQSLAKHQHFIIFNT